MPKMLPVLMAASMFDDLTQQMVVECIAVHLEAKRVQTCLDADGVECLCPCLVGHACSLRV